MGIRCNQAAVVAPHMVLHAWYVKGRADKAAVRISADTGFNCRVRCYHVTKERTIGFAADIHSRRIRKHEYQAAAIVCLRSCRIRSIQKNLRKNYRSAFLADDIHVLVILITARNDINIINCIQVIKLIAVTGLHGHCNTRTVIRNRIMIIFQRSSCIGDVHRNVTAAVYIGIHFRRYSSHGRSKINEVSIIMRNRRINRTGTAVIEANIIRLICPAVYIAVIAGKIKRIAADVAVKSFFHKSTLEITRNRMYSVVACANTIGKG